MSIGPRRAQTTRESSSAAGVGAFTAGSSGAPSGPEHDRAGTSGLAAALTREHDDIDAGVKAFLADLDRGEVRVDPLSNAIHALRRHIYLEETFVFPPIRAAGMTIPIMVMIREHGQLWRSMDVLADLLATDPDGRKDPAAAEHLATSCRELLTLLERHNSKEEPIIYPHADADLTDEERSDLAWFLRTGRTPDGWICQAAAGRRLDP